MESNWKKPSLHWPEWERFIALRVPTSAGRPKLKRKDRKTFVRLCFALR